MPRHNKDLVVTYHVEPADPSVGIMTEGFSAWENDGDSWCHLEEIELVPMKDSHLRESHYRFSWVSNDTGNETTPPPNAKVIESLLQTFVESWYESRG